MNSSVPASICLVLATIFVAAACTDSTSTPPSPDQTDQTGGLSVSTDAALGSDVDRITFRLRGIQCASGAPTDVSATATRPLDSRARLDNILAFKRSHPTADTPRRSADAFFVVSPGCYEVRTRPLDDDGEPANDCEPNHRERVSVTDGETTDVVVGSPCRGAGSPGLAVVSATNHPPELQNVEFQQYVSTCPARQRVCATASDADGDPIDFHWTATESGGESGAVTEATTEQLDNGDWQSCADVTVDGEGAYQFRVRTFDLAADGMLMEEVLADRADTLEERPTRSRASLEFPVYSNASCGETYDTPDGDNSSTDDSANTSTDVVSLADAGRTVTILMALTHPTGPRNTGGAVQLVERTVAWVSPREEASRTDVLFVIDDNAGAQYLPEERNFVVRQLRHARTQYDVRAIVEPRGGLDADDLEQADVVWFQNPDAPVDDDTTYDALRTFQRRGGGLILQGDDMARGELSGDRSIEFFSHLRTLDAKSDPCTGDSATEGSENTRVTWTDSMSELLGTNGASRLGGRSFAYGGDLDRVQRTRTGERVLAGATYRGENCSYTGPAVVAFDPAEIGGH